MPRRVSVGPAVLAGLLLASVLSAPALAATVAVAYAEYDPGTDTYSSSITLYIGPGDTAISWSLHGESSYDSEADPLTFSWDCDNRLAIVGSPTNVATLAGHWPAGTTTCVLTVRDPGGHTGTATATVRVVIDSTPPLVAAPGNIVISATEDGGARPQDSAQLADWLVEARATDSSTANPVRLSSLADGTAVGPGTLFPVGTPVPVTFRFADRFDNVGTGNATVTVVDAQDNDVFVGSSCFGGSGGGTVVRVRGGSSTVFCQSVEMGFEAFATPNEVIVDSHGRVVFLADLPSANVHFPHHGLFRCDFAGDTPRLLALYRGVGPVPAGVPVHFPEDVFERVNGLHLARDRTMTIDPDMNGGTPELADEDTFIFAAKRLHPVTSEYQSLKSVRYRSRQGISEDGPEPVQIGTGTIFTTIPDMTNYKGTTYSAGDDAIRRESDPVRVHVEGEVLGSEFTVDLALLGGIREYRRHLIDDVNTPNLASGCPPPPAGVSPEMPGPPFVGLTGLGEIAVTAESDYGLVVTSSAIWLSPYVANMDQYGIDDDPSNDNIERFQNSYVGCEIGQKVPVRHIMAFWDPTGATNGAEKIVAGPQGLLGAQRFTGRVFRVPRTGDRVEDIARLDSPQGWIGGIAAFPPQNVGGSDIVVLIEVDSPVNVLFTDALGRRIGVDESGSAVNDFGSQALDTGASSHPRFYLIKNPAPGQAQLRSVGTGDGPFTVHVYSQDLSRRIGQHIRNDGLASIGSAGRHDFELTADGRVAFANRSPLADAGSDFSVSAEGPGGAMVTLNGLGSTDPDGDALALSWAGPFGIVSGGTPTALLPVGVHTLQLTVDDGKGAIDTDVIVVSVAGPADVEPPRPIVTQAPGQSDPAAGGPVQFTVTFEEVVVGFGAEDVLLTGSTVGGILAAAVTGSGATYTVMVSGMVGPGVVAVSLGAGAAADGAGNLSVESSCGDCTVTLSGSVAGTPRLSGTVAGKGSDAVGFYVDVRITNIGTGTASDIRLTQLHFHTDVGVGTVSYNGLASGPLPVSVGALAPGGSTVRRLYLNVPQGVIRFSLKEVGSMVNVQGGNVQFVTAQSVTP